MQTMTVDTPRGQIVIRLSDDPSVRNTVAHFAEQANAGFYDGLAFHRVEPWVIQGGDPTGTGTGGGKMPAEYNRLAFDRGAVGVARGPDRSRNSDCQWFIVKRDAPHLDGDYTNFGLVTQGLDVVDQIRKGDAMTRVRVTETPAVG